MSPQDIYECTTNGVTVRVSPRFLDDESQPAEYKFLWAYTVEIENNNAFPVQLLTRYWKITDRNGRIQEVSGRGVVGQEPVIEAGEAFHYTSGAPLSAPSGVMQGVYGLSNMNGEDMDIHIPAFSLDSPYERARPN